MQKRFVDGIVPKYSPAPEEPPPKIPKDQKSLFLKTAKKETKVGKKRWCFRVWFWGGFLFLLGALSVFLFFFWKGLLGPELSLLRLGLSLNGKYLILFQNNTELRPGGGFVGSFAEAEIKNGLIKNYAFESNIYKRDKKFSAQTCLPLPAPAQKLWPEGCFAMKDSNWSPDFQESAEQVAWFYKQEGGNRIDGVIALDTSLFTDILRLIGPIEIPKYNLTITPDNFVNETQYYVEKAYFENPENKKINEPKTILKEMMPIVLERLKNPKRARALLSILAENLKEKHLLFSFKDPNLMKIVQRYNWGGEIKKTNSDYLYINNANLAGMKSSLNVKEEVILKSKVLNQKDIENTLIFTRQHQGDGQWPDAKNQNYTRVIIPKGSVLIDKKNIEKVDFQTEGDKTIFGFWSTVDVRESKTFVLTYRLPLQKTNNHSLLVQKQPGSLPIHLVYYFQDSATWKWEGDIDEDKIIEVDLTK